MSPSLTRVCMSNHIALTPDGPSSGFLTEPLWTSALLCRDGLGFAGRGGGALEVERSGEAVSFLYPVKTSSSPEGGGHILLGPCSPPWLLPPPLHCPFSLNCESEVREAFQGRHQASAVAAHSHIKGVLLSQSPG